MPIPTPPVDNSGGYMVLSYTDGTDTHKQRLHLRPFDATGTFTTGSGFTPPNATVSAEFTAYTNVLKASLGSNWNIQLQSIFMNNAGTFSELFGWTSPGQVVGTAAASLTTDQSRAGMQIMNFHDSYGGRARVCLIGQGGDIHESAVQIWGGSSTGNNIQQLVDYLSNQSPIKSCIVTRNGHPMLSPARCTFVINRRLRRHYGFQ